MNYNYFNSIDRLMEFGMGLAIARQMVDTMNYAMSEMDFAGQNSTLNHQPPTLSYYAVINNQQIGPLSETEIEQLIKNDTLTPTNLIWHNGLSGWTYSKDVAQIAKLFLLNNKPL